MSNVNVKLARFLEEAAKVHRDHPRGYEHARKFQDRLRVLLQSSGLLEVEEGSDPFKPFTKCVEQFDSEMLSVENELSDQDKVRLVELLKKHFLYDHLLALAAKADSHSSPCEPLITEIIEQLLPQYDIDCETWIEEVLHFIEAHKKHLAEEE